MSMLSDFMTENGLTADALVKTSAVLEKISTEERATYTKRAAVRRKNKQGDEKKTYEEMNLAKAKGLGRGVSLGMVQRAMAGTRVHRLTRHKIVRAVNASLTSAKKENVELKALFADVGSRKNDKKKKS